MVGDCFNLVAIPGVDFWMSKLVIGSDALPERIQVELKAEFTLFTLLTLFPLCQAGICSFCFLRFLDRIELIHFVIDGAIRVGKDGVLPVGSANRRAAWKLAQISASRHPCYTRGASSVQSFVPGPRRSEQPMIVHCSHQSTLPS